MDVPLATAVAVLLVFQVDWIPDPGANRSTQLPKFENDGRESVCVLAATVSAAGSRAGE
jgi:hypothetical protein